MWSYSVVGHPFVNGGLCSRGFRNFPSECVSLRRFVNDVLLGYLRLSEYPQAPVRMQTRTPSQHQRHAARDDQRLLCVT